MLRDVALNLVTSALGVILGISAFFVFSFCYGNYNVGFWSILSGILAGVCFYLHLVKGFAGGVAGFTASIWYIFLTAYYKIPMQPIADSTVITAVWSMICGKWGIFLMYHSWKYRLLIENESLLILTESSV
ncbi:hypothetical protein KM043_003880 [Ampulex compressa]|nr:hypothetical protein KM043_003880 [Ampulex compressa]